MPVQAKKYAVMYIPRSGLFFSGGDFMDGTETRLGWNRVIPVYRSRAAATAAKENLRKKFPDWQGDFVMISVELHDQRDPADTMLFPDDSD